MKNKIFRIECQTYVKSGKFNLVIYLVISEKLLIDRPSSIPMADLGTVR
jgi:hypothetical protein